jgi:hypothetical protein
MTRKFRDTLLALFLVGIFSSPAESALFSGAYLLELCKSDDKGQEVVKGGHTACQAYISGIIDYHMLLRSLGTSPSVDFCVPPAIAMSELQAIVRTYLQQNAENDGFIAAPAVAIALYEAFPCGG